MKGQRGKTPEVLCQTGVRLVQAILLSGVDKHMTEPYAVG